MEELILKPLMEHNHLMELLGAFLTGIVGPILYLLISRYLLKQKEKNRDIVKENIVSVSLISNELEEIREEFEIDASTGKQRRQRQNIESQPPSSQR